MWNSAIYLIPPLNNLPIPLQPVQATPCPSTAVIEPPPPPIHVPAATATTAVQQRFLLALEATAAAEQRVPRQAERRPAEAARAERGHRQAEVRVYVECLDRI